MQAITIQQPQHTIAYSAKFDNDGNWLNYFSIDDALRAVFAHLATLPSAATKEKHTARIYRAGLSVFLDWLNNRLPTEPLMAEFVAHLKIQRGLKSSTIRAKYLAPARLFLRSLSKQLIAVRGDERDFVEDCRQQIRNAADIKNPPSVQSSIAPLWRYGERLEPTQVNAIIRHCDKLTADPKTRLIGLRDKALMLTAFTTGLRLAELSRITPNSIQQTPTGATVAVLGKRSKTDPVAIPANAVAAIADWVNAYNAALDDNDPRRINPDTPVWQRLLKSGAIPSTDTRNYDPTRGLSTVSIANIIARRSGEAIGLSIAPHDCRRTLAAMAYDAGMPLPAISKQLRHEDTATTLHYIGKKPNFTESDISQYIKIG